MGDVTYRVVAQLDTQGELVSGTAKSKIADLDTNITKIGSGMRFIAGSVAQTFTAAVDKAVELGIKVGTIGVGLGAAATLFGIKFNDQMEQLKISLGTIFSSQGVAKDMSSGLDMAAEIMKTMRKDAAALPGTFSELGVILKTIAIPGFQGGLNSKQLEHFAADTMVAAKVAGVSIPVAAREMATLLSGHATSANVMALRLGITGDKASEFRHMDPSKRLDLLQTRLAEFNKAMPEFSKSFDAIFSTFKDNAQFTLGEFAKPIFESFKRELAKVNSWFNEHQTYINGWANHFGTKIAHAFEIGFDKLISWWPAFSSFTTKAYDKMVGLWAAVEPAVKRIAEIVKEMATNTDTMFSKIGLVAGLYGIGKVAPTVLRAANSAGGGTGVGVAGTILAALAVDFAFMEHAMKNSQYATEEYSKILGHLGKVWDNLTVIFSDTSVFSQLATKWGEFLLTMTDFWASFAEVITSGVRFVSEKLDFVKNLVHLAPDDDWSHEKINRDFDPSGAMRIARAAADEAQKKRNEEHPRGGGGTHIGKIEIRVEQTGDPSRVARAVMDKMVDLKRYQRSSPYVPNYSIR